MPLSHRMDMSSDKLCQQFEGQLCKYTNVMKGWQFRWFVLDPERGFLDYYLNESERKQRPRGSVHLAAAVISPSDEDSNTFTVNSATGEMFKLRASDARARHEWVSRIRSVAEMHTMAIAQNNPPLPPREHHVAPHTTSTVTGPVSQGGTRIHCSLAVLDSFSTARDHIHRADQCSYALSRAIEELPSSGECVKNIDKSMLLLKATAQATVYCLSQCLSILQQQQIAPAQHRSSAATTAVLAVAPRKPATFHPIQNEDFDSKKSLQHEWPEPMPVSQQMSLPSASEEQARIETEGDVTDVDEDDDVEENNAVPAEQKSVILPLLSQLKRGMDLTRVVLPTYILERRSLLEMFADCMGHTHLFISIPDESTPLDRMLAIVKWYLTSFHVGCSDTRAKKPYNPIIGEIFRCSWLTSPYHNSNIEHNEIRENRTAKPDQKNASSEDITEDSEEANETFLVTYTAEQVSHHPPVTAFYLECPKKKMYLNASIWTKSYFSGMSVGVNMIGELSLFLLSHGEKYDFTLPSAYARSLTAIPWMELGGKVTINCPTTKYSSVIIFHTKPFYGGKIHEVTGELKTESGAIAYRVQGEWNSHYEFVSSNGQSTTINVKELPICKKRVRNLSNQDKLESRKLWYSVTQGLKAGNIEAATEFKQRLEEMQRKAEKLREEAGKEFPTKYFHREGDNWIFNTPINEE